MPPVTSNDALQVRAQIVARVERFIMHDWPPWPTNMAHAAFALQSLSDDPQDRSQRECREALLSACEAYGAADIRADNDKADAVRHAWHVFEMMWRDKTGQMIPPNFLNSEWEDHSQPP